MVFISLCFIAIFMSGCLLSKNTIYSDDVGVDMVGISAGLFNA
jgi:hypothetical protein